MFSVATLTTAFAVALTITAISLIPNPRLKALVYSLPIPITLLVIATGGHINISHIYGLLLVTAFLWAVYFQKHFLKLPIILAVIVAAAGYVGGGVLLEPTKHTWFWLGVIVFVGWWLVFTRFLYKPSAAALKTTGKRKMADVYYYPLQGSIIFVIVIGLLSITKLLAGAVVAFPLNGVFTAYVMRDNLKTLASEFSRNSIGILVFLVMVYLLETVIGLIPAALLGWLLCAGIFLLLHPGILKRVKIKYS